MQTDSEEKRMDKGGAKLPYVKPAVESDTIYETRALGCAQCPMMPPDSQGFGEGTCFIKEGGY